MPIHLLTLIKQQTVARDTRLFTFTKPENFSYLPGQYGGFTLINPSQTDGKGITRRFSFSSYPDEAELAFATRMTSSAYKQSLALLKPGEQIKFAGPSGNFILHEDADIPAVMIAGGIGVTPFLSMLKHIAHHQPQRTIQLFYGNQTLADAAFLSELAQLQKQLPRLQVIHTLANANAEENWQGEMGFISYALLKKYIADFSAPIFYVCGSPAMVTALQEILMEIDIPAERIKIEDFTGY